MVKFKAKSKFTEEELNALNIPHTSGLVEGYLVGDTICGELKGTNETILLVSWAAKIDLNTLHQIEYTEFDTLSKEHGFFRAALIHSGLSIEEVSAMTEDDVEAVYGAMQSMATPY